MFTTVWGDWHLEMLERVTLPTLLADGNLPALAEKCQVSYRILTRDQDCRRISEMPAVSYLSETASISVTGITSEENPSIYNHLPWWLEEFQRARNEGSLAFAIHPDAAWSDGALTHAADHLLAGKKGILIPNIRIVSESSLPEFTSLVDHDQNGSITLSGREMAKFAIRHLHPLSMSELIGIAPGTPGPERMWPVAGNGFLAQTVNRPVILLDPKKCDLNERLFAPHFQSGNDFALMNESDQFLVLNLTPLAKDLGIMEFHQPAGELTPAVWSVGDFWDSAANDSIIQTPIRFHSEDCLESEWQAAETKSSEFATKTLRMRKWLKIRSALRNLDCALFADLIGAALVSDELADKISLESNKMLLAPADSALDDKSGFDLPKIYDPANQKELVDFIQSRFRESPQTPELPPTAETNALCEGIVIQVSTSLTG
jgi:hypothetical protein